MCCSMNHVDETFQKEFNTACHAEEHFDSILECLQMNIKMDSHQISATDCWKQFLKYFLCKTDNLLYLLKETFKGQCIATSDCIYGPISHRYACKAVTMRYSFGTEVNFLWPHSFLALE